ncbi:GGDEF domain-containing protein [Chitinimonas lacunae]|uniref:diguanylate cyclase n=1 Tax=Chitinimonas lacunae TaxID=1963018 RepID=A0ABV8MMI8_9NEIS
MSRLTNPTDIARETLRQLAVRRIPPTPDRYEEIYQEIAGQDGRNAPSLHPLVRALVEALRAMPRQTTELVRQLSLIEKAGLAREWHTIPALLIAGIEGQGGQAELTRPWADLIRALITQWERRSPHFNSARKSESLGRVLVNFGSSPALLNQKLDALVRSWSEGEVSGIETADEENPPVEEAAPEPAPTTEPVPESGQATPAWERWREMLAKTLQIGLAERLTGYPELAEEAASLAQAAEAVSSEQGLDFLYGRLRRFWIQLELKSEREERVARGLVNLLFLLTDNLVALSGEEDGWVRGQFEVVRDILSQPLNMRRIYDAEVGFKEVIYRQGMLRDNLSEAQASIKSMLSLFIDRLGGMAVSTGDYHDKIEGYAERIQDASGLGDLHHILEELIQDTRHMQVDITRSRDELIEARTKAEAAEQRIDELEAELRSISEKVREDQLTGALNRRGFDEAFATELARKERSGKPMCLAMLDIDNFKKLNDQLGHQAGDDALIHLVNVVRESLRPTDVVARYGGEEFVILLPETSLSEAAAIMRRVQRDLTKRFFLHNNERLLITFSAGVTLYHDGEGQEVAIERADQAMYEAKKAGKNQVTVWEE